MAQAIRIHEVGGPEVMRLEQLEVGEPGPGQARVKLEAVGLNFIDVYFRTGLYKAPQLPFIPGNEGAGTVVSVGPDVTHVAPGDRVAWVAQLGSYTDERLVPADRLLKLPDAIDFKTGAAMMLKGLTATYLLRRTFRVERGHNVLIHAAAGGVGLIACQIASHLGANVIGTVGSSEKAELARAHGCAHPVNYREEDFVARVGEITGGKKCDVVYDSVGQSTFPGSLDCLRPLGMWVPFGQSSGPIRDFDLAMLQHKGSLFCTRPTLVHYAAKRADLEALAEELFGWVAGGTVKIEVNQEFPLADAAAAHRALEGRKTTGATVLLP